MYIYIYIYIFIEQHIAAAAAVAAAAPRPARSAAPGWLGRGATDQASRDAVAATAAATAVCFSYDYSKT